MLKDEIKDKLLSVLAQHKDGISTLDIAEKSAVNRITVTKYLVALQVEGVIDVQQLGQTKLWKMTEDHDKPLVYIVDDEPHIVRLIKIGLGNEFDIRLCYSGLEFLEKVKHEKPDLVILDVMMPVMDGFAVAQKLSDDPVYKNVPFVFLSAKLGIDDRIKGLGLGAVYYLTKPFSPRMLKERVKSIINLNMSLIKNKITQLPKLKLFLEQQKDLGLLEGYSIVRIQVHNMQDIEENFSAIKVNDFLVLFSDILKDVVQEFSSRYLLGHSGNEFLVCMEKEKLEKFKVKLTESLGSFLPFIYEVEGCAGDFDEEIKVKTISGMKNIRTLYLEFEEYKTE